MKPFVRDKDAIQALILIAELAAYYKAQGKTTYDGLQELFEEYGYFQEKTISITMSGISGAENIKKLMASLRENAPAEIADVKIEVVEDYLAGTRKEADGTISDMAFDKADVLKYYLADGSWIAARPSGTEPKIKFYIGAVSPTQAEVDQKVDDFEVAINKMIEA